MTKYSTDWSLWHVLLHAVSVTLTVVTCITLIVVSFQILEHARNAEDTVIKNAAVIASKATQYYVQDQGKGFGAGSGRRAFSPDVKGFCESYKGQDLAMLLKSAAGVLESVSNLNTTSINSLVARFGDPDLYHSISRLSEFGHSGSVLMDIITNFTSTKKPV